MLIGDVLQNRATERADETAYSFTEAHGDRREITYAGLWSEVSSLAVWLGRRAAVGDRALILCDPSPAYLTAFFATVTAGIVAVPAYPTTAGRHTERVRRIVEDCEPSVVIADTAKPDSLEDLGLPPDTLWVDMRDVAVVDVQQQVERPNIGGDDLAFLQYTSGSTGSPKGVMVSHANLLSNAEAARTTFGFHPGSVMVSWLPPFHDMGLIGCIITPLVVGFTCHLMAPSTFIRRPLRWLELISEVSGTDSTAPNFAYRLCAERASEANWDALDLSSWTNAMNGAEPVSTEALDQFSQTFAQAGFSSSSFRPCYGMAEATLLISGGHTGDRPPRTLPPRGADAVVGAADVVSCGAPEPDADVRIVDPASGEPVAEGHEGEIWVSSPSVSSGYWNNREATEGTFAAHTSCGDGPFLHTGDLGFFDDGELFVTGRLKDVIIVNGRNIYPQDLEDTLRRVDKAFTGRNAAAFEHSDCVVVQVEAVAGRGVTVEQLTDIAQDAAGQLARAFEIPTPIVAVLRRGTLTTTSSGKIQRSAARAAWASGDHSPRVVALSQPLATMNESLPADRPTAPEQPPAAGPQAWIQDVVVDEIAKVANLRHLPELDTPLSTLALDSVKIAAVSTRIEERAGIKVPLSLAWEVEDLGSFIAAVTRLPVTQVENVQRPSQDQTILLTGAACRLPGGATDPAKFWAMTLAGDAVTGIARPGQARTSGQPAGLVPEMAGFAPAVFGLSDEEAAAMDPRQRLTLTLAWEALEDSGHDPRQVRGKKIGVYIGASDGEHLTGSIDSTLPAGYRTTGSAGSLLANRISYTLGLRGPSLVVDTACSSSLAALHLALRALRAGEIDAALVGGVNALLNGHITETLAAAGMLSPTGTCHTFDDAADGYVRGEGAVMLYLELERQNTAIDPYCAVLGSAVNQDGRSNGLTAPSGVAQQEVVRDALEDAARTPTDLGYIEAHGTGTPLGDPVEIHSLSKVLTNRLDATPVWAGSTKAQIGHLEAAAGLAGLLRAALIVRNGIIAPQARFQTPSSRISWERTRLQVPTHPVHWDVSRRTAGVSSFGFGGTNAHVIVESVPPAPLAREADERAVLLRLGANSTDDLRHQVDGIIGATDGATAATVAAALDRSRTSGPTRAWTIATGSEPASSAMRRITEEPITESSGRPTVALLAPGHGSPIAGSLRGIYGYDPVVTQALDELSTISDIPRKVLLDPEFGRRELRRTEVAQPALYTLAVTLGERLKGWGLNPTMVGGHSVGAFAAAALAGIFDGKTGLELIARRGHLMEDTAPGGMLSVQGPLEAATEIAAIADLDVAVLNSSTGTVLSGGVAQLDRAADLAKDRGLRAVRLPVSRAFHSRLMDPVRAELAHAVAQAAPQRGTVAFVSDVDATSDPAVDDPNYWVGHARHRIDFRSAAAVIAENDVVVELGPSYLLPLIQLNAQGSAPAAIAAVKPGGGMRGMLEAAGAIWATGYPLENTDDLGVRPARLPASVFPTHTYPLEGIGSAGVGSSTQPASQHASPAAPDTKGGAHPEPMPGSVDEWVTFLRGLIAPRLDLQPERISSETGLFDLGLTSVTANELRESVAHLLGQTLPSTIVFEYPTITRLATHLHERAAGGHAVEVSHTAPGLVADAPPAADNAPDSGVAVIGMACRLPGGAETPDELWSLMLGAASVMSPWPADRMGRLMDRDGVQSLPPAGYLQSDPTTFAADHFGISPREANSMDPQHRMLLEATFDALGDAGLDPETLRGTRTGVWMGLSTSDYAALRPSHAGSDPYAVTGNSPSLASGRIAHVLGTEGPAVTIDSACSSSLVAAHQAVEALRTGEIDIALVGGVNLMLDSGTTSALIDMGALSPSGRCATFGEAADGYARGEGCGVVVMRRRSDAAATGDRAWAVVRGTAVNHDGVSAGLTVPNGLAQQRLITKALEDADIAPQDIDYVEAHGTGTPLGDPIELEALAAVFDPGRDRPLPVSSIKAQIGHLEAAAGIAGLIKAILVAHHGQVPPHPEEITPTQRFTWSSSSLHLPTATPGNAPDRPLNCAVSSFGFSGTNAHVVLSGADRPPDTEVGPASVPAGRLNGHHPPTDDAPSPVWVFPGVGSQWPGMAKHLMTDTTMRDHLLEADEILRSQGQPSLVEDGWQTSGRHEDLQPALTAVQVALATTLRERSQDPAVVVGCSAGTIAALVTTGRLDLASGLALAAWRGKTTDAAHGSGATAACGLSANEASSRCRSLDLDDLAIAGMTGPENTTVSGSREQLAVLADSCRASGTWWLPITDTSALHHPSVAGLAHTAAAPPEVTWSAGDTTPLLLASGTPADVFPRSPEALLDELWRPFDLAGVATRLSTSVGRWCAVELAPAPTMGIGLTAWNPSAGDATTLPAAVPGRDAGTQLRNVVAELRERHSPTTGRKIATFTRTPDLPRQSFWWAPATDQPKQEDGEQGTFYRLRWKSSTQAPKARTTKPDSWVVVADPDAATGRLLHCALAARGERASQSPMNEVPGCEGSAGETVGVIIDVTTAPDPDADHAWHRDLLKLLQGLSGQSVELWIITAGGTTAGGDVTLGGAAVVGIARALSVELPDTWGGVIDIPPTHVWTEDLALAVVAEAIDGGHEDQVALRGGSRRVPRLMEVNAPRASPVELDPNAAYLVTGGAGTLGRRMLRWLVDRGARHLVVAARSEPEVQRERLGALLDDLAGHGATVHCVQADATNEGQLEAVLVGGDHPWPPVRGVLHLAGHLKTESFDEVDDDDLWASWQPKVGGAATLEQLARRHPLDFVILFSSASSVWGSAMSTAYVRANYGLDAIAARAAAQGLPFVSANWSWWPDTAMAEGVQDYFARMGLGAVTHDVGWAAMDRIVGAADNGLVVAPIDWEAFRPVMAARRPRPLFDDIPTAAPAPGASNTAELARPAGGWTRAEVEHRLVTCLTRILQTEAPIDPGRGFFDMGLDSIMTLELRRSIDSWSGLTLEDALIFENPRVTDLVEALLGLLKPDEPAAAPAPAMTTLEDLSTEDLVAQLEQELNSPKEETA